MDRRTFLLRTAAATAGASLLSACAAPEAASGSDEARGATPTARTEGQGVDFDRLEKSDDEWREILTGAEYHVLREEGTERAFSSPLNEEKRDGTFVCAGCFLPLFESRTKFDSGTGWPSFYTGIDGHTETKRDFKLILPRTEYHCARCGGHQGHVFNDGPEPSGQRWCNNGVALDFVPAGAPLPELRT